MGFLQLESDERQSTNWLLLGAWSKQTKLLILITSWFLTVSPQPSAFDATLSLSISLSPSLYLYLSFSRSLSLSISLSLYLSLSLSLSLSVSLPRFLYLFKLPDRKGLCKARNGEPCMVRNRWNWSMPFLSICARSEVCLIWVLIVSSFLIVTWFMAKLPIEQ